MKTTASAPSDPPGSPDAIRQQLLALIAQLNEEECAVVLALLRLLVAEDPSPCQ